MWYRYRWHTGCAQTDPLPGLQAPPVARSNSTRLPRQGPQLVGQHGLAPTTRGLLASGDSPVKAGHEGKGDRPSRICPQHNLPGRLTTCLGGSLLPIVLRDWWGI
nr:MAG TPA: hypothetical protein [Caudoviricetes sp.]